jgi:hypothetical protein
MQGGNKKGGIRAQEEQKFRDKEDKKKKTETNALIASLFKAVTVV